MSTTTQVIAEKGIQEFFIIREFDAPVAMVFEAFSTPDILAQFLAPFDLTLRFNYHNYKTGGGFSWSNLRGEKVVCTFNGVIHELTAPVRIVQTSEYMDLPERGHVVLEIYKFEELPGDKTRVTMHDVCPSLAVRDAIINSGMDKGVMECFNKLDTLLAAKTGR